MGRGGWSMAVIMSSNDSSSAQGASQCNKGVLGGREGQGRTQTSAAAASAEAAAALSSVGCCEVVGFLGDEEAEVDGEAEADASASRPLSRSLPSSCSRLRPTSLSSSSLFTSCSATCAGYSHKGRGGCFHALGKADACYAAVKWRFVSGACCLRLVGCAQSWGLYIGVA